MRRICGKKCGFGLLEVLLASVIIMTLIMALIFLSRMAISNTLLMQQRSSATFLAQQAIEGVRQRRDTTYIDARPKSTWDYMIDINSSIATFAVDTPYVYRVDTTGEPWISTSGSSTVSLDGVDYTRKIFFKKVDTSLPNYLLKNPSGGTSWKNVVEASAVRVQCIVTWEFSGDSKTVEIEELLTDSRQGF